MPIILTSLAALALANMPADTQPTPVCEISAETVWQPDGVEPLTLTARTRCEDDRILVERKVFDSGGHELFSATYPTSQVMTLAAHDWSGEPLEPLIRGWLEPDGARTSTADLPAYYDCSEFPFMPALNQTEHEAARTAGHPMHCYVQGMESSLCLALVDGAIVNMGIQRFPG